MFICLTTFFVLIIYTSKITQRNPNLANARNSKNIELCMTRSVNKLSKLLYAQLCHLREMMTRNIEFLKVTLNWKTHYMYLVYVKIYFSLDSFFFFIFSHIIATYISTDFKLTKYVYLSVSCRTLGGKIVILLWVMGGGTKIIIVGWPGFHDTLRKCTLTKYWLLPWWSISSVCRIFNNKINT